MAPHTQRLARICRSRRHRDRDLESLTNSEGETNTWQTIRRHKHQKIDRNAASKKMVETSAEASERTPVKRHYFRFMFGSLGRRNY